MTVFSSREIMTRAWELYKTAGCTSRVEFGLALKASWAEHKAAATVKTIEEKLYEVGGRYWCGGQKERIYLPCEYAEKAIGLVVDYKKSGYVASAFLEGKKISNTFGSEIAAAVDGIYFNLADRLFYRRTHKFCDYADMAIRAIQAS